MGVDGPDMVAQKPSDRQGMKFVWVVVAWALLLFILALIAIAVGMC